MKQVQFAIKKVSDIEDEIVKIKKWYNSNLSSALFFQIFSEIMDEEKIKEVCDAIEGKIPEAVFVGCSTNGNVVNGDFSWNTIAVSCSIFEYPSTHIETIQYSFSEFTHEEIGKDVVQNVEEMGDVQAIQILTTLGDVSISGICQELNHLDEKIMVFGGGAFSNDLVLKDAMVFSKGNDIVKSGVVFVFYCGDDLHIRNSYVTGWEPLGSDIHITKAEGSVIYELDGKPAYDAYYKYLHIKNDENFFHNTLEFPFIYESDGISFLRAPIGSNPDGSLRLSSDVEEGVRARISYGDPWNILKHVQDEGKEVAEFGPESVLIFSCAARRTFWGNKEVGKETKLFQYIAPTFGFYTSGEILRSNKRIHVHNVTMVIVAMREGKKKCSSKCELIFDEYEFEGKVSMINRMATFIKATTAELEVANRRLARMAIIDGLTGVFNRREIQRIITEAFKSDSDDYLIMMDVDNFKAVNDNFGHMLGDQVLRTLGALYLDTVRNSHEKVSCGRWGGEEFMLIARDVTEDEAKDIAHKLCEDFRNIDFDDIGRVTISCGMTKINKNENEIKSFTRVDKALYMAKDQGKDRVIYI
ncbi:MAG: diguanylate cyclase [Eubacterium sp.]|nr:diguanylate cyclase [Eubacterium sp.]